MLVLRANDGDTVKIGENMTVALIYSELGEACLGFDVPKEIPVHREKVYKKMKREIGKVISLGIKTKKGK